MEGDREQVRVDKIIEVRNARVAQVEEEEKKGFERSLAISHNTAKASLYTLPSWDLFCIFNQMYTFSNHVVIQILNTVSYELFLQK